MGFSLKSRLAEAQSTSAQSSSTINAQVCAFQGRLESEINRLYNSGQIDRAEYESRYRELSKQVSAYTAQLEREYANR